MVSYLEPASEKDLRYRLELAVDTLMHIEEGRDNLRQYLAKTDEHDRQYRKWYEEIGVVLLRLKEMGILMDEFMFHPNPHVREWASTLI